ncbi:MAG TPA: helix-turn-helix domain-containing protein [Aeriscardovia aeriphila]|uniref:Helix-turn-helix domain-containing protein n=1 Tax=Aeriscardovia aeriphila TaxID=218139 RepID=A0A921FUV3_9BIFI|nr:helix-turn-helix domain-containing protein [Aeriscardovia aeriphila]
MRLAATPEEIHTSARFAIQGYGKTYELTEEEFAAALRAADCVSDDSRALTTGQVAEILHVSAKTVARLLDAGKMPFYRNNGTGHRMVKYRDILAYQQKVENRRQFLSTARSMADSMGGYDSDE